jgi:hypothetical protein
MKKPKKENNYYQPLQCPEETIKWLRKKQGKTCKRYHKSFAKRNLPDPCKTEVSAVTCTENCTSFETTKVKVYFLTSKSNTNYCEKITIDLSNLYIQQNTVSWRSAIVTDAPLQRP